MPLFLFQVPGVPAYLRLVLFRISSSRMSVDVAACSLIAFWYGPFLTCVPCGMSCTGITGD